MKKNKQWGTLKFQFCICYFVMTKRAKIFRWVGIAECVFSMAYIYIYIYIYIYFLCRCGPSRAMGSSFLRFLNHTQRRITVGKTPLDLWSARRRDLYLTTHNTHTGQVSMPPVRFEPAISEGERPQTYALDRVATGTGFQWHIEDNF